MAGQDIEIALTDDEALVLFAWLRLLDVDRLPPAERTAVWALEAALEKVLLPPLRTDYAALLDAARTRLAGE